MGQKILERIKVHLTQLKGDFKSEQTWIQII